MTHKIIFKIDSNQDTRNWYRALAIQKLPYGLTRKKANANVKMIKDYSREDLKELTLKKESLEKYFVEKGKNIFQTIEKITEKPIYTNEFYASFTTAGFRPYDLKSDWFMVSATDCFEKQITDIVHELFHLQAGYYYKEYCLKHGLSEKQFYEINETLTFLLNEPEFRVFELLYDEGYPGLGELRNELQQVWFKEKNFKSLIDAAINSLKN